MCCFGCFGFLFFKCCTSAVRRARTYEHSWFRRFCRCGLGGVTVTCAYLSEFWMRRLRFFFSMQIFVGSEKCRRGGEAASTGCF